MNIIDGESRDEEGYLIGSTAWEMKNIRKALDRIANAQESMLAIGLEARGERMKMAAKMADAMKRPLMERENGDQGSTPAR